MRPAVLGILLVLSSACSSGEDAQRGGATPPRGRLSPPPLDLDEAAPPAPEDPSELLFLRGLAHQLDLQLEPDPWRQLGSTTPTEVEVPGTLRFDGGLLKDVNVSLRGRFGS